MVRDDDRREGTLRLPRARAVVASLVLCVPVTYATTNQGISHIFSLLTSSVSALILLVVLNALIRFVFRRALFDQSDLVVAFLLTAVASSVASEWGAMTHSSTHVHALAAENSPIQRDYFIKYLPEWLIEKDIEKVRDLTGGGRDIEYVAREKLPIFFSRYLAWGLLFFLMTFAMLCINSLMREAWCRRERLAFPLIQLPVAMSEDGGRGGMWKSKPMWIAFGLMFGIDMLNGFSYLYPNLPNVPVKQYLDLQLIFKEPPWSNIGHFPVALFPFMAAIGLLIPSDLLFSFVLFFLLRKAAHVVLAGQGIPQHTFSGTAISPGPPYFDEQTWGGLIALFVTTLYISRGYLREVWRDIKSGSRLPDGGVKHRWAFIGLLLSCAGLVWFGVIGDLGIPYMTLYIALFLIFSVVLTRMRAQLGPPTHEFAFFGPSSFMHRFFGNIWLRDKPATWLSSVFITMNRIHRTHPMPYQLEGMKMASNERLNQKAIFILIAFVTVFCFLLAQFFLHAHRYRTGHWGWWWDPEGYLRNILDKRHGVDLVGIAMTIFGFTMVVVLDAIRFRVPTFPVHPAGYVLSMNYGVDYYWFGLLIALLVKNFVQRYYGLRGYDKLRNVALGILLGEYAAETIWMTMALITNQSTYTISFNDRSLGLQ